MARSRPSSATWAGGLYHRLLARGLDPYSAKMVSRHVRADAREFFERLERELAVNCIDRRCASRFIEAVMGVRPT